jgi:hypothetical protein
MSRRRENFIHVGRRSIGIVTGGLCHLDAHGKAVAPAAGTQPGAMANYSLDDKSFLRIR